MIRLTILFTLLLTSSVQAAIFFDQDWESSVGLNPPSPWIREGQDIGNCTVSTDQNHTSGGTKSVKLDYTVGGYPSDTGHECSIALSPGNNFTLTRNLWIRAWRYATNFQTNPVTHGDKYIYLHTTIANDPNNFYYPNFVLGSYSVADVGGTWNGVSQNSKDCFDNNGNLIQDCYTTWIAFSNIDATPITNNVWHCFEANIQLNTLGVRDAIWRQWVDGNLTLEFLNFAIVGDVENGPNGNDSRVVFGMFQLYRQSATDGSVVYWDDVAVGDTRIGCAGGSGEGIPTVTIISPTSLSTFITKTSPLLVVLGIGITLLVAFHPMYKLFNTIRKDRRKDHGRSTKPDRKTADRE